MMVRMTEGGERCNSLVIYHGRPGRSPDGGPGDVPAVAAVVAAVGVVGRW